MKAKPQPVSFRPNLDLSVGQPPYTHQIIEGDNHEALQFLQSTHKAQIKCIYIDPPYNTGNTNFVYKDRFFKASHPCRHSAWLEFMEPRLRLTKDLLHPEGAIFISIDDHELFSLGLLMNQVFGESNFVTTLIWQKNFAPKNSAKHFSVDHEYILVYAADADIWKPNPLPRTDRQNQRYKNPDDDPRGPWMSDNLSARNPYIEGSYAITCPSGRVISGPPPGRYWTISLQKFRALDQDRRIWWGKTGDQVPRLKRFLSEVNPGRVPQTFWPYTEVGHTQEAKKELLSILDFASSADVFSTPKPLRLLERILRIASGPDDIVLDFFAGSGTTGHAVLNLNRVDGGNRQFILISNKEASETCPEKNLCRDICAERLRRVIEGYTNSKGETVEGIGGSFLYLESSGLSSQAAI